MTLYYREMGDGFPLVLIHGFPFDHTIFLKTAEMVQESARVILPDLRGFGRSRAEGTVIGLHEMAGGILELLDDLGIEQALLAGHSMGGYVGLDFCQSFPGRAVGLVLIASHTAADTANQRQSRRENIERVRNGETRHYLMDFMLPSLSAFEEVKKELAPLMLSTPDVTLIGALTSMAERSDGTEWLRQSGIPSAFICGEEDAILPVKFAVENAARVGAAPVIRVPGTGHMLIMENPRMTASGLLQFLEKIRRGVEGWFSSEPAA